MTEKELRKLNRYQLLELLIAQINHADRLQKQLERVEAKYISQDIKLTGLGSIAEASLQVSGVFEAAQKAADSYLDAAKQQADEIVRNAQEQAREILADARRKAGID